MQLEERRSDPKRIDVARPLEAVRPGRGDAIEGYTRNLSATGLRARFDSRCSVGANLLVRIELEEGAPPVEERARVVWSAPDVYGQGMEVGLRLLAPAEEEEPAAESPGDRAPLLATGSRFEVDQGGIALPVVVTHVGELGDRGVIQVTLRLADDGAAEGDDDDLIVVEKAPIVERTLEIAAETRRIWLSRGAPLARRIGRGLLALARAVVSLARRAWMKAPRRITAPADRAFARVRLAGRSVAGRLGATGTLNRSPSP